MDFSFSEQGITGKSRDLEQITLTWVGMDTVIPISAKRSAFALTLIVGALVALSVGASALSFAPIHDPLLSKVRDTLVRLFWLDGEANVPTWYSASLLLLCASLLAIIAGAHRQRDTVYDIRWLILAVVFLLLSLDETAQLHELAIAPLRERFHTTGFLYYAWIVPAGICSGLFALAYLGFLAKLPVQTARLMVLAGALYVGGALGVESLSAKQASLHGEHTIAYHAIITVEELLEMSGLVVFIYALLDYIGRQFPALQLRVSVSSAPEQP
jgi:hypothetical protein